MSLWISLMVSESRLRASWAGRYEWRSEGAREVEGLYLAVEPVSEGWRAWFGWGWAVPGTESMLARAEVGTVWGETRPEGAETTEGGGAAPRPRGGRIGWS